MADAQRTIDLVFNAVDKTGPVVDSVLSKTRGFASGISSATQPFADATAAALKFEAAILGVGATLTGLAIREAVQFESALADLNKVLGDNENIEVYIQQASELARQYGISSSEVIGSIANFKQAGLEIEEASILTRAAIDLVIAGDVAASEASQTLVQIVKGFGIEAAAAAASVDLINEVTNNYGLNVAQLSEGLAQLSPVASAAGLSLQETVAILTPGIEVFQSGSEVANALRTVLNRLVDDSAPTAQGLAALGVAQRDANGELRTGRDIFFDVAEALSQVGGGQQQFLAQTLVGSQRSGQFLAVVNNLSSALRIAGDDFEFVGSAAREVETRLNTTEKVIDRVIVNFSELQRAVGGELLDNFRGTSEGLIRIFNAIEEGAKSGSLDGVIGVVEEQFDSLADLFNGIADALPEALASADLSGFEDGLRAISDAVSELFGDLDLTDAQDLARVLEVIADAFNGLSQFSGGVIASFEDFAAVFVRLADSAAQSENGLEGLGRAFGRLTQVNIVAGALGGVTDALIGIAAIIFSVQQGKNLITGFTGLAGAITGVGGAAATVTTLLTGFFNVLNAGAAGFTAGTLLNRLPELFGGEALSTYLVDLISKLTGLEEKAKSLSQTTFIPPEFGELEVDSAPIVKNLNEVVRAITGVNNSADPAALKRYSDALVPLRDQDAVRTLYDLGEAFNGPTEKAIRFNEAWKSGGTFSVIESGANKAASALKDFSAVSDELQVELAIAQLEAATSVSVARIQADAERVAAAFDSIGVSVTNTGDRLGELFGLLGDENISKFDKLGIKEQIDAENTRLDKQLRLQERLTEAEIRRVNAQTRALNNGGALITVNGDGLQPHLEAFMFEILQAIQVRASAEGFELLLGAGNP